MVDLHDKEIHGVINAFLHALETNAVPPCNIEDNLKTFAFNCAVLEAGKTDAKKNLSLGGQFNSALISVPKLEEDCYDWYARHEDVLRAGRKIDPEIVLIGDSITHFWGGEPASETVRGPISWQATFGKYRTLNMGFGWDRIQNVLWRLEHGEFNGLAPHLVILNIGINNTSATPNARCNTPEEIAEGISAICCRLRKFAPNVSIIVMGLFPCGQYPADERRPLVARINRNLAAIARETGVTFLDIGHLFLEPDGSISSEIMSDFTHPTEKGYMLWAKAIRPLL
ncbi:MAG: GDSL-type esterase/lipase family protein [Kiritimatiellaeota bacterium]|nr:GDSL-type esterase/lipase family protein [Kiritimatiellota bacterium]